MEFFWANHIKLGIMTIRSHLITLVLVFSSIPAWAEMPTQAQESERVGGPFTFANVARRAAALSTKPYEPDQPELPPYLANLNYDQFRDIRFRPDLSLWKDEALPFRVQFFSRGFVFHDRVKINVIDGDEVKPFNYQQEMFDFGKNPTPENLPEDTGFAGFRLHYPINRDDVFDEVSVFLGASYFRAVGQNLNYGINARGLAIDTGLSNREEFPIFREFWLVKPERDATEITLYALMDSKSVTGAYCFVIKPGIQTQMEVKSRLHLRTDIEKIGIAPLTSMFFHGENKERWMDDFRPEVHDSDGLLVVTGNGEHIWRPLSNPKGLRLSDFKIESPKSFGLLQRDRNFNNYQDLEAHYHNRPSILVEPEDNWGKGTIQLVEIPSTAERYDNIVAYWIPETPAKAGDEMSFKYKLTFSRDPEEHQQGGRTLSTRIGAAGTDDLDSSKRKFVIDFAGETLSKLPPDTPVEAVVAVTNGKLIGKPIALPNKETQGWRLFFEIEPESGKIAELRAFLRNQQDVLSETWTYQWMLE